MKMKISDDNTKKDLISIKRNLILSSHIWKCIVSGFRMRQCLPEDGFKNRDELKEWKRKNISSKEKRSSFDLRINRYINLTKTRYSFIKFDNYRSFVKSVRHYLFFNPHKSRKNIRVVNNCELIHSWGVKNPKCGSRGIFIKISPYSKISEIKKFITDNSMKIKLYQNNFQRELGFEAKERTRKCIHEDRDRLIYDLYQCTIEELSSVTGSSSKHKDIQIENAMKDIGYDVTSDHVRKIIQIQKKKHI